VKVRQFWLAASLLGCAHARGGGRGELEETHGAASGADLPVGQAVFSWKSGASASEGTIHAKLPDGLELDGTYLQVTDSEWQASYGPYWQAWTASDWGAPSWYTGPQLSFVTHYAGKLLAHLVGTDGTRMRCTFELKNPPRGLKGGATGECQLSTDEKILDAVIY
jgi:hypothetical protein